MSAARTLRAAALAPLLGCVLAAGAAGEGYAVGTRCYRGAEEAAVDFCAQARGMTSEGYQSCVGVQGIYGREFTYQALLINNAGERTYSNGPVASLQSCTPQDWQTHGPVVAAWFLAIVTIGAARMVYTTTFKGGKGD